MSSTHSPPFLHVESTLAFNDLTAPKTANITASSPPTQTTTNDTYATSATYDFPDGGRFKLNLSGPPFTAFVDGLQGLPDGFLMEINNFIFSNLCNGSKKVPIVSTCEHASLSHPIWHACPFRTFVFREITNQMTMSFCGLPVCALPSFRL